MLIPEEVDATNHSLSTDMFLNHAQGMASCPQRAGSFQKQPIPSFDGRDGALRIARPTFLQRLQGAP